MAFPPARRPPSLPRKSLVTGPGHSGTCRARLCTRLVLVQVAVGAEEPRAAGSAGRELGEPRLGLVEQTTTSGTIETLARVRGGLAGGNLQSVGRQLVKGVVLIHHQTPALTYLS